MKICTIIRGPSTDEGTFGILSTDDGLLTVNTLELPWRDNAKGHSCIPTGVYKAIWHKSPSKGWVYMLTGTEPRTDILVHAGNWAGDVDKGWQSQLLGCIALGKSEGKLKNDHGVLQRAILTSRMACNQFYAWANQEPVLITIK